MGITRHHGGKTIKRRTSLFSLERTCKRIFCRRGLGIAWKELRCTMKRATLMILVLRRDHASHQVQVCNQRNHEPKMMLLLWRGLHDEAVSFTLVWNYIIKTLCINLNIYTL